MATWDTLPQTWGEWLLWDYNNPNLFKMDTVSDDYNLTINEEFKEYKYSGNSITDKDLINSSGQFNFSKYIDNVEDFNSEYQVMTKEFIKYIQLNKTFTIKLKDLITGNYKLLVNCRLNKKPSLAYNGAGNKEDIVVDFEKVVDVII